MSAGDLFTRELWEGVAKSLRGVPGAWWDENRESLTALAKEEVQAIAQSLQDGDTTEAKLLIAGRMEPSDFALYVTGTTAQLQGIARRRADLMDALEDLGIRAARRVGKAILTAILA